MCKLSFQSLVYSKSYGVFCVTETWLSSYVLNNEILPYGYTIYRCDRDSRGGGVMIAVADGILSRLVPNVFNIEMVTVALFESPILVSCLYIAVIGIELTSFVVLNLSLQMVPVL